MRKNEELENKVYGQIRAMVTNYLKESKRYQDVDDISHEIATDYFERIHTLFDPNKGALSTFVYRYVEKKIKGLMYRHEIKIGLDEIEEPSDEGSFVSGLEFQMLVEKLAGFIDSPELLKFFQLLVDQVSHAKVNLAQIAEEMGISGAGCSFYLKKLRKIPAFKDAFEALA